MSRSTLSGRRRRVRRLLTAAGVLLAVAAGGAGAVATAGGAAAHSQLEQTDPVNGAQTAAMPGWVTLTFNETVIALGSKVEINGPAGDVADGPATVQDHDVRQGIRAGAPPGVYTVLWRVTSADGHPVSGSFGFTAASATSNAQLETGSPPGPATQNGSGQAVIWLLIAAAAVVVAAGIYLATRHAATEEATPAGKV